MGSLLGRPIIIDHWDYCPRWLERLSPLLSVVERRLRGDDRNDYYLLKLEQPFYLRKGLRKRLISHLVVCSRWKGQTIDMVYGLTDLVPVNIFLVLDNAVLSENRFNHKQVQSIAIGTARGK